jgi:hypothetical protein
MENIMECNESFLDSLREGTISYKSLDSKQKHAVGRLVAEHKFTPTQAAYEFKIPKSNIYDWKKHFLNAPNASISIGRPPALGENELQMLKKYMLEHQVYKPNICEYNDKFEELIESTERSRGNKFNSKTKLSRNTQKKIEKRLQIQTGNAEATTEARKLALQSERGAISFAVMNYVLSKSLHPSMILNADSTQFTVGCSNTKKVVVKYIRDDDTEELYDCIDVNENDVITNNRHDELDTGMTQESNGDRMEYTIDFSVPCIDEQRNEPLKTSPVKDGSGITSYFIKYYLLMSADGKSARPIFIIADGGMPKDKVDVYHNAFLSISATRGDYGYLVFVNSRQCNLEFFKWFNKDVLVPYVESGRKDHNLGGDSIAFFQLDGEKVQIDCYDPNIDPKTLEILNSSNISVGKPPAGTTAATQPCDRGNCFKSSKTANKKICNSDIQHKRHEIEEITGIFQEHFNKFGNSKDLKLHMKTAIYGILRIQLALYKGINCASIQNSFSRVGIYPYNINQIFKNFKFPKPESLYTKIANNWSEMVLKFIEQGELLDDDFDKWDIPVSKKRYKDSYAVGNRRSVLLTHKALIKREYEKYKKRHRDESETPKNTNKRGRPSKNASCTMPAMDVVMI